jgi:hypothetical protein
MKIGRARTALAIGMVLLAASCGQEPETAGQAVPMEGDQAAGGQQGEGDERVVDLPYLPTRSDEGARPQAAIDGTLRADPDTGCVWLDVDEIGTVALIWIDELRVRFPEDGPAQVEDGEGTVYAVEGETVELGGGWVPEPAERCDQGQDGYFWAYFPKDWSLTS